MWVIQFVYTVIVHEVRYSNAEQRAVQTCVQANNTLAVENPLCSSECTCGGLLLLDLSSCGEGD